VERIMDNSQLGRVFLSRGVMAAVSADELSSILLRHATGERRIIGNGRATAEVVSEFAAPGSFNHSLKVWVVTEPHDHRTTVMLSSEEPEPRDDHEFHRTHAVIADEFLLSSTGLQPLPRHASPPVPQKRPAAAPSVPARIINRPAPPPSSARARDAAYWDETAELVLGYFQLLAGSRFSGSLLDGFIEWLKRSPDAHRQYVGGDDMDRAALVERFLTLRRLPRE